MCSASNCAERVSRLPGHGDRPAYGLQHPAQERREVPLVTAESSHWRAVFLDQVCPAAPRMSEPRVHIEVHARRKHVPEAASDPWKTANRPGSCFSEMTHRKACGSVAIRITYLGEQMRKLKLLTAIALVAFPLLLAGCSSDGYGIAALEAPAGPEDVLPKGSELPFPVQINDATLRLLVEDDGRQYFGAESADGVDACVAVFSVEQQFGAYAGCGAAKASAANRITTVGGLDGKTTTLVRDNADTERLAAEGFRRIHQNVYVAG